jgi:hypothetical protein
MFLQRRQQERHADRGARKNTVDLRSERGVAEARGDEARQGTVISAGRPQRGAVLLGVALAAAARVLRDRRFEERVIAGLVVQAALARIAQQGLGRAVKDIIAWDNARLAEWKTELRRRRMAGAPGGAIPGGAAISARQPEADGTGRGAAWAMVGLAVVVRVVRDLRLGELAVLGVIALAAAAQISGKDLADILRTVIAWDNERLAKLREELRRQHEAKAGQAAAS